MQLDSEELQQHLQRCSYGPEYLVDDNATVANEEIHAWRMKDRVINSLFTLGDFDGKGGLFVVTQSQFMPLTSS